MLLSAQLKYRGRRHGDESIHQIRSARSSARSHSPHMIFEVPHGAHVPFTVQIIVTSSGECPVVSRSIFDAAAIHLSREVLCSSCGAYGV